MELMVVFLCIVVYYALNCIDKTDKKPNEHTG
jgi:hypothetical protein